MYLHREAMSRMNLTDTNRRKCCVACHALFHTVPLEVCTDSGQHKRRVKFHTKRYFTRQFSRE